MKSRSGWIEFSVVIVISLRGGSLTVVIDLNDLHHAEVLVVHHVAVEHVFAGEIEETRSECDAAIAREDRRVHPDRLVQGLAIDLGQQHVVRMDVENVIVRLVIDDSPLFYSSQANSLIDSIGIKRFTINGEPESPPKLRRPLDTPR